MILPKAPFAPGIAARWKRISVMLPLMCTGINGIQLSGTVVPKIYLMAAFPGAGVNGGGWVLFNAIASPLTPFPACEGTRFSTAQTIPAI